MARGALGCGLGASIFLPTPCQPSAFWVATQSLTFESPAVAGCQRQVCLGHSFISGRLGRSRVGMGSAIREIELCGVCGAGGGEGERTHLLGSWCTWSRGEGVARSWTRPAVSVSSQPLNHDTSEQTR